MIQPSLLADIQREERPWKVVRRVSRGVYLELRKGGYTKRSGLKVLTGLAYYRNRTGEWATPAELAEFLFRMKKIPRPDSRITAPRLTELVKGCTVRRKDGTRVRLGGGVCVLMPTRICRVSGQYAHPVAIREAGSEQREELRRSA